MTANARISVSLTSWRQTGAHANMFTVTIKLSHIWTLQDLIGFSQDSSPSSATNPCHRYLGHWPKSVVPKIMHMTRVLQAHE
jgi:hypothetical protein